MAVYRINEAAAVLGVSPDTVRRWVDADRLPAHRDQGGRRVVEGADLAVRPRPAHDWAGRQHHLLGPQPAARDRDPRRPGWGAGPGGGVLAETVIKSTNVVVERPGPT